MARTKQTYRQQGKVHCYQLAKKAARKFASFKGDVMKNQYLQSAHKKVKEESDGKIYLPLSSLKRAKKTLKDTQKEKEENVNDEDNNNLKFYVYESRSKRAQENNILSDCENDVSQPVSKSKSETSIIKKNQRMDAMLKHLLHSLDEGQCISKDITKMLVPMPELEKSIEIYLSMMKDQLLHLQPEDWPEYVGRSLTLVKEFKNKKRYRSELQNRNEQQQQKDEPQCSNEQLHKDEQKLLAQCPGAIQMHQYQPAQQPVHIYVHTKI